MNSGVLIAAAVVVLAGVLAALVAPRLLPLARAIDAFNSAAGRLLAWLILVAVIVSTVNAVVRKAFNVSSNGWLELQWYLFAAVFLGCAAYTFLAGEHIRIDILNSRFSKRARDWVDVIGHLLFLMPFCAILIYYGWPFFTGAIREPFNPATWETSPNAGGLITWPAKLMVPLGFLMLLAQGFSELVKRSCIMKGVLEDEALGGGHQHAVEAEAERLLAVAREAGLAPVGVGAPPAPGPRS